MWVPGAISSGFQRPSPPPELTGPRLEKLMTSAMLFAPKFEMPQPSLPVWRWFSEAPTVSTLLAVLGVETELLPGPSLPAAKITRYS